MKKFSLILLSILIIFTGCKNPNNEKALRFDLKNLPYSLDPQTTTESESTIVLLNTMSGLTKIGKDGTVEADLAEKWETANNGRQYKFILRDNLKWEDGKPLTAKDFVFALKRLVSPKTNSPFYDRYLNIKNAKEIAEGELSEDDLDVTAVDDKTLIINLIEPDASFPSLMAQSSSLPCNEDFFDSCKGKYGLTPKNCLANGAFTIESRQENLLILERNEYSLQPSKAERLYLCTDRGDITDAFVTERSEACIVPHESYEKIISFPHAAMYNQTFAIIINPKSPVGSNENYRKALMLSAQSDKIKEKFSEDLISANGIIPPTSSIGEANYRDIVGKANIPTPASLPVLKEQIQEEINLSEKGKFPKTEIITTDDNENFPIASSLQNIWSSQLSVYINISPLAENTLKTYVEDGNYDIAVTGIKVGQNKASEYLRFFSDCVVTINEETKTVGEHLADIKDKGNSSVTSNKFFQIENALIEEYYVLPIYHSPTYFVTGKKTKGIEYIPSKQSVFFGNAELTE